MKYVLAVLALLFCTGAQAQDALVVATCGTLPLAYAPGATRLLTIDVNGKLCGTGGGGAGNPGGSANQVQYNSAGSFGGFTFSGDFTLVPSTGVATLKNTGPGATGALGSATVAPIVTIDAQGRVTALSSATITPAIGSITGLGTGVAGAAAAALNTSTGFIGALTPTNNNCAVGNGTAWTSTTCPGGGGTGANPTATAGPTAVNGVATTFLRSDGAPAIQQGSASQKGIVQVDGTTITATSGVISAPPAVASRTVTGATDTILAADLGNVVYYNRATAVAVTQPAPSGSFASGFFTTLCNINAGVATVTPASGTIGGAGSKAIPAGSATQPVCLTYQSDGTNFNLIPGYIVDAALLTTGTVAIGRLPTGTSGGTIPLLNGTNTFSGTQTFGSVVGTVTTQAGTTYTFAATDCGTTVRFSNGSAVTATIPQGLPVGCNIAVLQAGAGQVSVNGSAVTPATLQSAHSYTKTFGAGAMIGITNDATNHVILTGDGA